MMHDPWNNERCVAEWLKEAGITADIPVESFVLLAGRIKHFSARPWTSDDIALLKKSGLEQIEHRHLRRLAVESLNWQAQPWRKIPGMAEHVRRWDEAIAVLEMPIGALDIPYNWLSFSKQGQDMKPWVYMATEIAGFVLQLLRSYGLPAPTFGEKSPVVKFTHKALTFVSINKMPTPKTLAHTLAKTLAPLLKDWPKPPGNDAVNTGRPSIA